MKNVIFKIILQDSREAPLLALHTLIDFRLALSAISHEKQVNNLRAAARVKQTNGSKCV